LVSKGNSKFIEYKNRIMEFLAMQDSDEKKIEKFSMELARFEHCERLFKEILSYELKTEQYERISQLLIRLPELAEKLVDSVLDMPVFSAQIILIPQKFMKSILRQWLRSCIQNIVKNLS
jgi:hypothetical protein